jgi:glycosyltransferase involved in cell wall biosynthesis
MRAERVLVVTDEMEVGGSQRQIVHLLRGLRSRGRQAELLYFRERSHLVDALEADEVPVHRIDKRGAVDPAFIWRLQRFLRAGRFDVVHAFSITAELWVRLVLPFVPGLRLVSSVRGLGLAGPDWHWRAKRWIVRGSSAVISNTRAGAELVARRCAVPVQGIDIVPNGLELPPMPTACDRAAARRGLGLTEGNALLLFVGRLVPEKNLPLLMEAVSRLPPSQRPLVWLAGEGPERRRVEAEVARLGLGDHVRLLGERTDTRVLMRAADLLVLPSREEGLSNVLLEAMASGLPVIATAVGGSPELIDDRVTGRLLPSDDAATLAETIATLVANADERLRLAAAARAQAESRFTLGAMVDHTARIYDRCVDASRMAA